MRLSERGARRLVLLAGLFLGLCWALLVSPVPAGDKFHIAADRMAYEGHAWLFHLGKIVDRDFSAAWGPIPQVLARFAVALRSAHDFTGAGPMIYFVFRAAGVVTLVGWVWLLPLVKWWQALLPLFAFAWTIQGSGHAVFRVGAGLVALRLAAAALHCRPEAARGRTLIAASALVLASLCSVEIAVFASFAIGVGCLLLMIGAGGSDGRTALARAGAIFLEATLGWGALLILSFVTAVHRGQGLFVPLQRVFERATTYSLVFGKRWAAGEESLVVWALLLVLAVVASWRALRAKDDPLRFDYVLLMPFAIAFLKTAMTRSDRGHIAAGLLALLALLALLPASRARRPLIRGLEMVALGCGLLAWPTPTLPTVLFHLGSSDPVSAWRELREQMPDPELLPNELLAAASGRTGPVFVFPLQIALAAAMNRELVAPFDQAYGAATISMQNGLVSRLRAARPDLEVVYGLDGLPTWRVDRVQSITRSPEIARYLLSDFERNPRRIFDRGFLLLSRRAVPRRLRWEELDVRSRRQTRGKYTVELSPTASCPLMQIEMRLDYPAWRWIGWSGGVWLRASRKGVRVFRTRVVPLQTGRPFRTLASPLRGEDFARLFDDGAPPHGQGVDRLDLEAEACGPFCVPPRAIQVLGVECLR